LNISGFRGALGDRELVPGQRGDGLRQRFKRIIHPILQVPLNKQ
jgi:hypothetical protein